LQSCGWVLADETVFSYEKLAVWLADVSARRIKGLLNTQRGMMLVNENRLTPIAASNENRLEILAENPDCAKLKKQLESLQL